jgi:hypothetical protein
MQRVPLYDGSGVQGQAMMDFVCSLNVIFAVKQQADDGCTIKRNANSSGIKMIELDRATEGLVHAVVKVLCVSSLSVTRRSVVLPMTGARVGAYVSWSSVDALPWTPRSHPCLAMMRVHASGAARHRPRAPIMVSPLATLTSTQPARGDVPASKRARSQSLSIKKERKRLRSSRGFFFSA